MWVTIRHRSFATSSSQLSVSSSWSRAHIVANTQNWGPAPKPCRQSTFNTWSSRTYLVCFHLCQQSTCAFSGDLVPHLTKISFTTILCRWHLWTFEMEVFGCNWSEMTWIPAATGSNLLCAWSFAQSRRSSLQMTFTHPWHISLILNLFGKYLRLLKMIYLYWYIFCSFTQRDVPILVVYELPLHYIYMEMVGWFVVETTFWQSPDSNLFLIKLILCTLLIDIDWHAVWQSTLHAARHLDHAMLLWLTSQHVSCKFIFQVLSRKHNGIWPSSICFDWTGLDATNNGFFLWLTLALWPSYVSFVRQSDKLFLTNAFTPNSLQALVSEFLEY